MQCDIIIRVRNAKTRNAQCYCSVISIVSTVSLRSTYGTYYNYDMLNRVKIIDEAIFLERAVVR